MFESYNSPANQSAVDRLIQLATGKKAPARAEDRPASAEAEVRSGKSAEAAEPSDAERLFRLIDGHPAPEAAAAAENLAAAPVDVPPVSVPEDRVEEQPFDAAPVEHNQEQHQDQNQEQYEQPVPVEAHTTETSSAETDFVEAHFAAQSVVAEYSTEAAEPAQAVEEVQAHETDQSAEPVEPEHATEAALEHAVELSPVAESMAWEASTQAVDEPTLAPEPEQAHAESDQVHEEPAQAVEEAVDTHPFYDDRPFYEAPLESAPAESGPVETAEAESVSEPAAEEAAKEETALESAPESAPETDAEQEPLSPAAEAEKIAAAEVAEHTDEQQAAIPAEPAANRVASYAESEDSDEEPFNLEKYLRLSTGASTGHASAPDVVPSPDETTFLRSKGLSDEPTEEEIKELAQDPMWKTLMKFKGWLPMVSSMLPLLDLATGRNQPGMGASEEVRDSMAGLMASHRDVRITLQGQTTELKRVEEEVAHLRDVSDKAAFEQAAMSEDMRSVQRLLKNAFLYVGIVLGLLVVVVAYMAFLVFSYLNHPVH